MNINNQPSQLLENIRADLINSLQVNGKDTSGQIAKQLIITTDGNSAQLQIPGFLQVLETGRGPTSKNAAKSNPPMIQRIKQWCCEKGIPEKEAWAIKKSIDKKGFKGIPGLISTALGNDNINMRLDPILEQIAAEISKQIVS